MNGMYRRFVHLLMALSLTLLLAAPSLAGVLEGSRWDSIILTAKSQVKGVGTALSKDPHNVEFAPDGSCSVSNTITETGFSGTYYEDRLNGKITCEPLLLELEDYVRSEFERMVMQKKGLTASNTVVSILDVKDSSKGKYSKGKLQYQAKFQVKYEIAADLDGENFSSTGALSLAGKGVQYQDLPDELLGTSWDLDTVESAKINGVGSYKSRWYLQIFFGPNESLGLGEGEFLADDSYAPFRGTYARSGNKGVIQFTANTGEWETRIEELIDDELRTYGYVADRIVVELTTEKFYGNVKKGALSTSSQVLFTAVVTVNGQTATINGKFSIKGKGSAMQI